MPNAEAAAENWQLATGNSELPVWRCPNCGQSYFGKHPPDLCDYCQDFTTWHLIKSG